MILAQRRFFKLFFSVEPLKSQNAAYMLAALSSEEWFVNRIFSLLFLWRRNPPFPIQPLVSEVLMLMTVLFSLQFCIVKRIFQISQISFQWGEDEMAQMSASTFCCGTGESSCVQPGPSPGQLCWGWQLWPFLLARERILNVVPAGPCTGKQAVPRLGAQGRKDALLIR